MRLDRGPAALACFAAAHLTIVAMGASRAPLGPEGTALGDALRAYASYTGADAFFGYFSPRMPDQVVATITRVDPAGRRRVEQYGLSGDEVDLRVAASINAFARLDADDLQARTFAAFCFNAHPEADRVEVSLSLYRVPSMAEARAGAEPFLEEFYRGAFIRRPGAEGGAS